MDRQTRIFLVNETQSRQTGILIEKLQKISFTVGFSSDSMAIEATARAILQHHPEIYLLTTPLLGKRNFGQRETTRTEYMYQANELSIRAIIENKLPENKKLFNINVENDKSIIIRLTHFLRQTTKDYAGKNVLVIAHSDLISTLLSHLGYEEHINASLLKLTLTDVIVRVESI
jgi:broad specificity phosphatase PhoE